jgi:hypothetical protein
MSPKVVGIKGPDENISDRRCVLDSFVTLLAGKSNKTNQSDQM